MLFRKLFEDVAAIRNNSDAEREEACEFRKRELDTLTAMAADIAAILKYLTTEPPPPPVTGIEVEHSLPVPRYPGDPMQAKFIQAAAPATLPKHKVGDAPPVSFSLHDDNGDTVTVTGLNSSGKAVDISAVATLTVTSSAPTIVSLGTPAGMAFDEEGLAVGTSDITVVATWNDGSAGPFTFTYTDTVTTDPVTGLSIAHGPVVVRP